VSANVSANIITIEGKSRGDLNGHEKVIIRKTGNVEGNIVAPRVVLEDGAVFKGSIDMTSNQSASVPKKPEAAAAKSSPATAQAIN
jgi:cytoskeletal protein CcmA (bactofilin family)